ncbi:TIR domain-containing protein [Oceanobacillus caeni]
MADTKPRVFIGSSREAINYVNAIQALLSYHAEVTPWSAGTFRVNDYNMESLERQLDSNDFAIFVFSPDDIIRMREKLYFVTRDNTLFEMGLFWGKLRKGRVFYIIPQSLPESSEGIEIEGYHLASDLDGITVLNYETRIDGNLRAAVNVACDEIITQIQSRKHFQDPVKLLQDAQVELEMEYSLIRFFRKLSKRLLTDTSNKYEYLCEALWNAFQPPDAYTVEGIGVWEAQATRGLQQIAGNEGRDKFYPFNINNDRDEEDKILVVDCFLNSEEQVLLIDTHFDKKYVLCYPIDNKLVITVAITGRFELSNENLNQIFLSNHELIKGIHYLFGGVSE